MDITNIKLYVAKWNKDGTDQHDLTTKKSVSIPQFGNLKINKYAYNDDGTVTLDWSGVSNDLTKYCEVDLYSLKRTDFLPIFKKVKSGPIATSGSFTIPIPQPGDVQEFYLSQYHYNNNSLNHTSSSFTVPVLAHPTGITAQFNPNTQKTDLTWTIDAVNKGTVAKYGFKLQRDTTSADFAPGGIPFAHAVDIGLSGQSTKYDKSKTTYTYSDDPYKNAWYRVARNVTDHIPPNTSWGWNFAKTTHFQSTHAAVTSSSNVRLILNNAKIQDTLKWEILSDDIWAKGSKFVITRIDKTTGSSTDIKLDVDDYYHGQYIDSLITPCNEYYYTLQVIPASGLGFETLKPYRTTNSVTPVRIGNIYNLRVSKGYFPDRVELSWHSEGVFDNYIVMRKAYGSTDDFKQIASVPGGSTTEIQATDNKGTPGVYYEYKVTGVVKCNGDIRHSPNTLYAIGFRAPTGNIYGRVTYEDGQAVKGVAVRLESQNNTRLGQSIYLNGKADSYLKSDSLHTPFSDSALTVEAWVKPDDTTPKNQVIFSRKNQYELGFDNSGKLYFSYKNETVSAPFDDNDSTFVHIAAIHDHDSLKIMLGDSVIARKAIPYSPANHVAQSVFIGHNTSGYNYKGYIDEVLVWNKALNDSTVAVDYTRLITGGEAGLVAYWRFDETINNQFYDLSHDGDKYNMNDGTMDPNNVIHTDTIPTFDQLALKAYTDSTGNYMISGIPYTGVNGTTYRIVPQFETHQFDPTSVNRLISASSPSFTVDFKDNSSFPVSGTIYYRNSTVPVEGVQFQIDGRYAQKGNGELIKTNAQGQFTISVPVGIHEVKAVKSQHVFINGGKITDRHHHNLNYQGPKSELILYDSTTVRFIGRVAGGAVQEAYPLGFSQSKNNLGKVLKITLKLTSGDKYNLINGDHDSTIVVDHWLSPGMDSSRMHKTKIVYKYQQHKIIIYPDSITGEFEADLIPEEFQAGPVTATGWDDLLKGKLRSTDLTNKFVTQQSYYHKKPEEDSVEETSNTPSDSIAYNYAIQFIKRVDPQIEIVQTDISGNPLPYFGDKNYMHISMLGDTTNIKLIDDQKTGKQQYILGYPVFSQNALYHFKITAFEEYPFYESVKQDGTKVHAKKDGKNVVDDVPTKDGVVSIYNNLRNGPAQAIVVKLDTTTGMASYDFYGGDPDFVSGGIKDFSATLTYGSGSFVNWSWLSNPQMKAYVTGDVKVGKDFVTAGPNITLMVLRDPPGNKSYSFAQKGTTISTTTTHSVQWNQAGDQKANATFGAKVATFEGAGIGAFAGTITAAKSLFTAGLGFHHEEHGVTKNITASSTTLTNNYQTSSDPTFVNAPGDVYIGKSLNITYGESKNLLLIKAKDKKPADIPIADPGNGYLLVESDGIGVGDKFNTLYAYPQQYLIEVLIPHLIKIRNTQLQPSSMTDAEAQAAANSTGDEIYVSKLDTSDENFGKSNNDTTAFGDEATNIIGNGGPSYKIFVPENSEYVTDTIRTINQYIQGWKDDIANNEKEKLNAKLLQNYSFHAGSPISYSKQTSIHTSKTTSFNFVLSGSVFGATNVKVLGVGIDLNISESAGGGRGHGTTHDTTYNSTFGFQLASSGIGEYLSVDVDTASDGSFVFRTKGGETECPYEGATYTKYYNKGTLINQSTAQMDNPAITVDNPTVNNVPSTQSASYKLHLMNNSQTEWSEVFVLSYGNTDSVQGAAIKVDGKPLAGGLAIVVPYGKTITKVLTLSKGPKAMNYNNIPIILHSSCQYDPTGYQQLIADTVLISAHFVPSCSNINIKSPLAQWILNTSSPTNAQGKRYFPIVLNNFDMTNSLFDHIELQYKPSSTSQWITKMSFYGDSAKFNAAQGAKQLITNPQGINYNLVMDDGSFNDQKYDIRALAVCKLGPGNLITTPSKVVTGIKDTYNPRLFGTPQPANGILGVGDEIRLNFNEPIAEGLLTHTDFHVTGIRNGANGDHSVSIDLDGKSDYAATEFKKNLAGKDITVEMWVLPDKQENETIFSQGNINNSMEIAFTGDNHMQVIIGKKVVQSDKPLDYQKDQWAHVALVYNASTQKVSAFYNFKEVIHDVSVGQYTGIGPFEFGRSISKKGNYFAGKMHDVSVWSKVITAINLQINSLTRFSGAENALLAYYPMTEGKGNILFDKAHGNNAQFTGIWSTPPGRSLQLDGNGYLKVNTAYAPITPDMDFTIGLWFKGSSAQNDTVTLASSGKGDGTDPGGSHDLFFLGFENGLLTFENNGFKVQVDSNYLDGQWHQVAIAVNRNAGVGQLFVDGELQKYFDAGNIGGLISPYTYLGVRAWYDKNNAVTPHIDDYFKGKIDEFRIWNTYLNQPIIKAKNNTRLKGDEMGLLAYYPFEKYYTFQNNKELDSTLSDMKIQPDPKTHVPNAIAVNAGISDDMAPVKDRGPVDNLSFDFVANNDAVIINMLEPKQAIDKTIVTIQAGDIRDKDGNPIVSPITWTAYIDQNQLKWGDEKLNFSKDIYKPLQFESYIVNNGGSVQHFRLDNLPAWLTAFPSSGTVDPEGKQKILFTVNKGLNVGTYNEIVYMLNDNDEAEALTLNLKVIGNTPDWKVNPADFKYNMSVYGKIRIDGIFSEDKDDMLAAFINGKCVGVTHNTYFKDIDLWYAFLPVYSNDVQNNHIEFRIWDASTGKIYEGIPSEPVSFTNDGVAGNPDDPVIFDGKGLLFRNISLNKGWNWLSFDLVNKNLEDINTALANGSWMSGDIIKHDIRGFDQYSSHNGWIGTLTELDNTSLFKLKTGKEQTLSISGTLPDLKNMPVTVKGNQWNYISYLPQVNMTLKEALADYQASSGDEIKSQTGFSMYSTTKGWVGNLTYLEPGKGYMLFRKAQSNTQFVYPNITGSLDIHRLAENGNAIERLNPYQDPVPGNFSFSGNMTMIATVGKEFTLQPNDHILAFTGNDLRGKAKAMNNTVINKPSFFLNISGRQQLPVYFCIERGGKIVAKTEPVIAYFANSRIGSLKEPFMLHFNKTDHKSNANEVTLYPNPFKNKVEIRVNLKTTATHKVQISVWNASGQLIYKASEKQILYGYYHTTWNGKTTEGYVCTPGVYFVHIRIDNVSHVYKVIKY